MRDRSITWGWTCLLVVTIVACDSDPNIGAVNHVEQGGIEAMWRVRSVRCEPTLLERSRATFPFSNHLRGRVRLTGIRRSCGCADVSVRIGERRFKVDVGASGGMFVELRDGLEKFAAFVDVGTGEEGDVTVDLRMEKSGNRSAIVWVDVESGNAPVALTVRGSRRYALWGTPRALDLGKIQDRGTTSFAIKICAREPELLRTMYLRCEGFGIAASCMDVVREDNNWCCRVVGYLGWDANRKGYVAGRIRIGGVDGRFISRDVVLRGYAPE